MNEGRPGGRSTGIRYVITSSKHQVGLEPCFCNLSAKKLSRVWTVAKNRAGFVYLNSQATRRYANGIAEFFRSEFWARRW